MSTVVYVGCYTSAKRRGNGSGIEVFAVHEDRWEHLQSVPTAENPSWLSINRRGSVLYAAHGDGEIVSSFTITTNGTLQPAGTVDSGGFNGVALLESADASVLWTVNHVSGTIATLALDSNGIPHALQNVTAVSGTPGPDRAEQPAARPHHLAASPDGRWLYVPDKGLDVVHQYRVEEHTGRLISLDPPSAVARRGSGPRHCVVSDDGTRLLVLNEIDSTMAEYLIAEDGTLSPVRWRPTLPDDFFGYSMAAEIALVPGSDDVVVSNRGHDSIVTLSGEGPVHSVSSGGSTPRFMAFGPDENLYVANQDSDTILRFDKAARQGGVEPTIVARTGSPSCLAWRVSS